MRRYTTRLTLIGLCWLGLWESVGMASPAFWYYGFGEVRGSTFELGERTHYALSELVRTDLNLQLSDRLLFSATVEGGFTQERMRDVSHSASMRTSSGRFLELERFFMDAYFSWVDLRFGKQAVHWGSAFLVNPTDPFPELLETEPWRSRSGINAARGTVRFGNGHQNQVLVGMDDDFRYWLAANRTTFRMGPADLSVSGGWREETESGLVGLDLRGNYEIGYWIEGGMHLDGSKAREEIAIGADYSFAFFDNLVIIAQYYRNNTVSVSDHDSDDERDFSAGVTSNGNTSRATPVGRDFGICSIAVSVTPDFSISCMFIQRLQHSNRLVVPVVTFTPGNRWELSAAAQLHSGRRMDGTLPRDTYIAWARMSF